jgi:hypothetical protein
VYLCGATLHQGFCHHHWDLENVSIKFIHTWDECIPITLSPQLWVSAVVLCYPAGQPSKESFHYSDLPLLSFCCIMFAGELHRKDIWGSRNLDVIEILHGYSRLQNVSTNDCKGKTWAISMHFFVASFITSNSRPNMIRLKDWGLKAYRSLARVSSITCHTTHTPLKTSALFLKINSSSYIGKFPLLESWRLTLCNLHWIDVQLMGLNKGQSVELL